MAIRDALIPNGTGSSVRNDIELTFQSIKGNNSTANLPAVGSAELTEYMFVAHTTGSILKVNNAGSSSTVGDNFVPIIDISSGVSSGTHIASAGSTTIPGYRFMNNAGTTALQTGMGLPVDTRLGLFLAGSEKVSVLSDGKVGIGTTSPSDMLMVSGGGAVISNSANDAYLQIEATNASNNDEVHLDLATGSNPDYAARFIRFTGGTNAHSEIGHRGTGQLRLHCEGGGPIVFKAGTTSGSDQPERWEIRPSGCLEWSDNQTTLHANLDAAGVIVPRGIASRTGDQQTFTTGGNVYNWYWTGTAMELYVDNASQGTVTTSSDYRVKKDITTQTASGIDKIKQLRPVNYEYTDNTDLLFKGDGVKREGFIAHEVAEIIPSAVDGEKDEANRVQSLRLDAIVSVLTKALQEAVAKIETLETKVAALEGS